jgi:hypothetical protein
VLTVSVAFHSITVIHRFLKDSPAREWPIDRVAHANHHRPAFCGVPGTGPVSEIEIRFAYLAISSQKARFETEVSCRTP